MNELSDDPDSHAGDAEKMASEKIDAWIEELGDWRGETLARTR